MIILSLDPGQRSGIAIRHGKGHGEEHWQWAELGPDKHHFELYDLLIKLHPDVIVYETFEYRHKLDNANLMSREYIGIVELYDQYRRVNGTSPCEVVAQSPATGIGGFWKPADKLQKVGLYHPTAGRPHTVDATRHLLQYVCFTRKETAYLARLK